MDQPIVITELPLSGETGFAYFDDENISDDTTRGGSERIRNNEQDYACTRCSALLDEFIFFCAECSDKTRDYFCENCIEECSECELVFCNTCNELTQCESCETLLNCPGHYEKALSCSICIDDFCSDCLTECHHCDENSICEACHEKNKTCECDDYCCQECQIICEVCKLIFCPECLTKDEHLCQICGICGQIQTEKNRLVFCARCNNHGLFFCVEECFCKHMNRKHPQ
jgi:hypothetical protein